MGLGVFVVAAVFRGIRGVYLPRDLAIQIRDWTSHSVERLRCTCCQSIVLADRDDFWITRSQTVDWFVSESGALVDPRRGKIRFPVTDSKDAACELILSPSHMQEHTPRMLRVGDNVYENQGWTMVQHRPYFWNSDRIACGVCYHSRRRRLAQKRLIWSAWRTIVK